MNKNKIKKFFTLKHRPDAGFTLVELIVVIAILAILAGVSVPAYTGYIKRAEEAKDQLLIAAVNEAFAGGCLEAGVELATVTEAAVSVVAQCVFGVSSVDVASDAQLAVIANTFELLFDGNFDTPFNTENVLSLKWVPANGSFEMDHENAVASKVFLSSGKTLDVSAAAMEMIAASTYADMGYEGVKAVIEGVGESGETLAGICSIGTIPETSGGIFGIGGKPTGNYSGLLPKLTKAMKDYGLIDETKEKEMLKNLCLADDLYGDEYKATADERDQSIQEAANGLSVITAKYLAGGGDVKELIAVPLGDSATGVIEPIASGTSGTKTVSAIAIQYALASGFANSDASKGVTIDGKSVSEYLATAEDPVAAIDKVKSLDEYKENYVSDEPDSQYQKDINGFVGTMAILGDNVGSVTEPGNINLNDFLTNGVGSADAKDALTAVLGK